MLKTLTSKFTFFFWLIFLVITLATYLFSTIYIKEILHSAEKEKIELMANTLRSTIAFNISFNQDRELQELLTTILKEKNIKAVVLSSETINKKLSIRQDKKTKIFTYKTDIKDPFSPKNIATLEISYSNEALLLVYNKIIKMSLLIFLVVLAIFLLFYLFIKKELNALAYIAKTLKEYSSRQQVVPINLQNHTPEIMTIANETNEMMHSLSKHLNDLESFNHELEKKVQEKVAEIQTQEQILLHQSRQAAMGEMIESIAHQWRQPLNIIGLSCANLETEYELGIMKDESFTQKMHIISSNINYMSNTIDDFRNFLNPNRKQTYFNPKETIEDVLKILEAQLTNNNITLTIIEEDEIEFYGVENEFKQVLLILLNNSKDAIVSIQERDKTYKGQVNIYLFKEEDLMKIKFCDNGGGIKKKIIDSIFEPYFTTKFASSGTGIGLHIAKNIIEARMHGKIQAMNITSGCCFSIEQKIDKEETV